MRKFGVKLFILVLMMMTSLALVLNVRAVEDDFVDFDNTSSSTTQTTETTETQKTTEETKPVETPKTTEETPKTTEETKTTTDKSTTAHVQAGVFENSFFIAATILLALSIGFGCRKLKQYKF